MNDEILKLKKELADEKQKRIDVERKLLKRAHEAEDKRNREEMARLQAEDDYNGIYNKNINLENRNNLLQNELDDSKSKAFSIGNSANWLKKKLNDFE